MHLSWLSPADQNTNKKEKWQPSVAGVWRFYCLWLYIWLLLDSVFHEQHQGETFSMYSHNIHGINFRTQRITARVALLWLGCTNIFSLCQPLKVEQFPLPSFFDSICRRLRSTRCRNIQENKRSKKLNYCRESHLLIMLMLQMGLQLQDWPMVYLDLFLPQKRFSIT